ncbi:hypothetical protein Tco_1083294 [Tanacetum coccineum]
MSSSTIKQIIAKRVADALITYKAKQKSGARTNDGASGSAGGARHTNRGCSYKEFLNCKPHNSKEAEGAVGLIRNELQKMEIELWNLSLEGIDITGYIWGLKEEIKRNVTSFKPITIQGAIRMSHDLMDQVVRDKVTRDADNKRKRKMIKADILAKIRGMKWLEDTLLDQVTRKNMLRLYHSMTSANFIITMVLAPFNEGTARRSVTKQETARPLPR